MYTRETTRNPNTGRNAISRAVRAIAQQYSSATFVSLRFYYRKENLGASFRNIISTFVTPFFSNPECRSTTITGIMRRHITSPTLRPTSRPIRDLRSFPRTYYVRSLAHWCVSLTVYHSRRYQACIPLIYAILPPNQVVNTQFGPFCTAASISTADVSCTHSAPNTSAKMSRAEPEVTRNASWYQNFSRQLVPFCLSYQDFLCPPPVTILYVRCLMVTTFPRRATPLHGKTTRTLLGHWHTCLQEACCWCSCRIWQFQLWYRPCFIQISTTQSH